MKLLFDQNISYKLVNILHDLFPDSNHVRLLNLETSSDKQIWEYAKKYNFIIVTQDSDFNEMGLFLGYPPKIIWLKPGNTSTKYIENLFITNHQHIIDFYKNPQLGCLEIY